ncbi:GGDEF domain protein [Pirellula sp. SH-Sr6A]|uniref:GGDEF domain-containing protein n=1 Tax=Pirellula sp. SH-Sr6A TaxID=1632865 RepID=UPI00078E48B3|nr:GGDEF domain-containing protein [Pirellula sp. SH-Sr6A]AMV34040.1 GGDEF domain protein [Pirellula sp. SH-Sr6A]
MNFLRFITIENLCLAAEITTALLLLALAFPDKKKSAPTPPSADDAESLRRLETARRAHCQATVFRGIATLSRVGTLEPAADRFQLYEPLSVLGWEDRLTKLGNRSFLDTFLDEWLSLPERARHGSLLTMIIVDRYSDLLREKGAMGVEQSLRDLGEQLAKHYESTALIGRYQPDRFLVIQFERSLPEAHEDFEALLKSLQSPAEPSSIPHAPIPCVASIVELGDEGLSLSSSLDRLDEGVSQALESGASCVSEYEGAWTNKRPMSDHATAVPALSRTDPNRESDSQLRDRRRSPSIASQENDASSNDESPENAPDDENAQSSDEHLEARTGQSTSEEENASDANTIAPETTDVSAVASSEDIAALFAQINKKKQETTSAPTVESNNDVVDSHDIAALFAANTPKKNPSPKPEQPSAPPAPAASNSDDVVGADDIAALFAANAPQKNPSPKPEEPPAPPTPTTSNSDDVVGADDIAALFAANAPKKNPSPKPEEPSAPPIPAASNSDDVVGADDIAALFAANTPKKKSDAKQAAPKLDSKLNELLSNLHQDISNDDLDSLFANVT